MSFKRKFRFSFLVLLVLSLAAQAAFGSIWLEPKQEDELRLEAVRAPFSDADFSTFSMVWFLSGNFEISPNLFLKAEVPYAHFASDRVDESSNAMGNPYLGFEVGPQNNGFLGELGVRLPVASDTEEAVQMGAYTDFVDRLEAFYPKIMPIVMGANYKYQSPTGFGMRLRVSPIIWIDTDDMLEDGMELWVRYSAQALIVTGQASIGAGLSGRYFASDDGNASFDENSFHEMSVFVNLDLGRWQPSARLRVPLDEEMKEMFDPSFVLSLGLALP